MRRRVETQSGRGRIQLCLGNLKRIKFRHGKSSFSFSVPAPEGDVDLAGDIAFP
jgi:hypothetical protein